MKEVELDSGKVALIGESSRENWDIIEAADPADLWFHVLKGPSPHVILQLEGDLASKQDIKECAALCKQFAHARFRNTKTQICYTKVANVELGDEVGQVKPKRMDKITI